MERYFGALTIALLLAMVLIRVRLIRRKGIQAMHFGKIDKKDFLIPPFALFYFYTVLAAAFNLPLATRRLLRGVIARKQMDLRQGFARLLRSRTPGRLPAATRRRNPWQAYGAGILHTGDKRRRRK